MDELELIDLRVDELYQKIDELDQRVVELQDGIDNKFKSLDHKFESLDLEVRHSNAFQWNSIADPSSSLDEAISKYPAQAVRKLFSHIGLVYSKFEAQAPKLNAQHQKADKRAGGSLPSPPSKVRRTAPPLARSLRVTISRNNVVLSDGSFPLFSFLSYVLCFLYFNSILPTHAFWPTHSFLSVFSLCVS